MKIFIEKMMEIGAGYDQSVSEREKEIWIKEAEKLYQEHFNTIKGS